MKTPRVLRTIGFRLTALYAALFGGSTILLFAIVYWIATDGMQEQVRLSLRSEMDVFATTARTETASDILAEVRERLSGDNPQSYYYGLYDPSGEMIAGNLPIDLPPFEGWLDPLHADDGPPDGSPESDGPEQHLSALGEELADGSRLTIVADISRQDEAAEAIARAFAWAASATLLLALAGGFAVSRGFLRRIDAINRTTSEVMHGDLGRRLKVVGSGDELDRLGHNLNAMLDRLQHLMDGLKQVSNDIAHDLRTPLSRLKHGLEAARQGGSTVEDYREAVDRALGDTDLALSMFGALLRIAQIEAGTRRSQFTAVDLSGLLTNVAQTYAAVAEDGGKSLTYAIEGGVVVHGDRELLIQMFVNLIENALRHTSAGAAIELSLRLGPDGPVAEVSDNGPGIPEAERDNVLRRFYRLDSSRGTPGSGLGLALVSAVAELHEARLVLIDGSPGLHVSLCFPAVPSDRPG